MWKVIGFILSFFFILFVLSVFESMFKSCGESEEDKIPYSGSYLEMSVAAVNDRNFAVAHKILDKIYVRYLNAVNKEDLYADEKANQFWSAANHVYKAEMLFLLPQNDVEANNRLVYTLQFMNVIGIRPQPGETYFDWNVKPVPQYVFFVDKYNELCNEILELSISYKNKDMASRVLKLFKPNYLKNPVEHKDDEGYCTYEEVKTTQRKAQKRYQQAVDAGEFN